MNARHLAFVFVIAAAWTAAALPAQTMPTLPKAPTAPTSPAPPADSGPANPELVGALAKEIGATPEQAQGAAGALFGLAKTKLKPEDWTKVAGAVPGMDGLLAAAPAVASATSGSGMGSLAGAVSGAAGLGGLASVAGSFEKLGLKPEMVAKAVPVLTDYVSKKGGADVGTLLAGALK